MSTSYNNLANVLHDQGKLDEPIAFHELSLPLMINLYGEDHPRTAETPLAMRVDQLPQESWVLALTRAQLGAIPVERGKASDALPLLEQAYARLAEVQGENARETRFAA